MKSSTKTATATASIFDRTDIEVPLSYDFLPDVSMKFFMRLQMNKEAVESNQKFLGLSKEQRDEKDHENNVHLLATLSTRFPEGVPGLELGEGENVGSAITRFFSDRTEMKQKVCIDVLNRYFRLTQPKEYL